MPRRSNSGHALCFVHCGAVTFGQELGNVLSRNRKTRPTKRLSEFIILCGDRWINGKRFQRSELPSEFADHPFTGQGGLSYLSKKVFCLVKNKDVYRLTGVIGCFLDKQSVKRDLALSGGAKIQSYWETEAHWYLLQSCAAAKRHNGGRETHRLFWKMHLDGLLCRIYIIGTFYRVVIIEPR